MAKCVTREEKALLWLNKFYQKSFDFTEQQFEVLVNFDKQKQANNLSPVTRSNYLQVMSYVCKDIKTSFKAVKKDEIRDVLNSWNYGETTTRNYKVVIKLFFAFVYGCKRGQFPEVVDWIETRTREIHKKVEKEIITGEEYANLLKGCLTLRDRAIISFFYHTGARVGEVGAVNIGDITFDTLGRYVTVKLKGKTGERKIVMVSGIGDLEAYLKQHPENKNKDAPLFLTLPNSNRPNQRLGFEGTSNMLQELGNRTLKRHINPHLFRHTMATRMAAKLSDAEMRIYFGWSKTSPMPGKYSWLKDKNVNEKLLIDEGLIEKQDQYVEAHKDIKCPRCTTMNSFDSQMCRSCFYAFTEAAIDKKAVVEKVLQRGILGLSKEDRIEIYKEMIRNGEIHLENV